MKNLDLGKSNNWSTVFIFATVLLSTNVLSRNGSCNTKKTGMPLGKQI